MTNEVSGNHRYQIFNGPNANELMIALCSSDDPKPLTFQVESDFGDQPVPTELIMEPKLEILDHSEVRFYGRLSAVGKRVVVVYCLSDQTGWLEVVS